MAATPKACAGHSSRHGSAKFNPLKPRLHQQQCRSNVRLAINGNNGNNVNEFFVKFRSLSRNKLNMFNLFRICGKDKISFNIVVKNGSNIKATVHLQHLTMLLRRRCWCGRGFRHISAINPSIQLSCLILNPRRDKNRLIERTCIRKSDI